ncbi:MAG: ABC transporter transmembrane domain-containing protein [Myxococcota bacterium]
MRVVWKTYLRLLGYVRPYALGMALAVFCMAVLSATTMVYAFLSGPLLASLLRGDAGALGEVAVWVPQLKDVINRGDKQALMLLLPLLLLGVAAVKGVAYAGQFVLIRGIGQRVMADLRNALFDKMLTLPVSFHETRQRGDLMARFTSDVQNVEQSVTDASADAIRHALQVVGLVIQAFLIDWQLAAACFISVPATFWPVSRFGRFLKRVGSEGQARIGQMTSQVQETLHGIRVVQAFGGEEAARTGYREQARRFVRLMDRSVLARGLYSPTMEILGVIGIGILLRYAGGRIVAGELSAERFISFITCMFLLYAPIKAIGKLSTYVINGVASAERLFEVLDAPITIADKPDARALTRARGEVTFRDIRFRYVGDEVLRGVDLTVRAGEVVALVGPSGSGKTTLLALLPRFHDPVRGQVLLDGVDVRDYRLRDLRRQIATVTQDTVLFHATVRENIRYGRPDATDADVEAAARAAHAWEFIAALPRGLDTLLGENGVNLSGGQRQRVAIARALIRDAPILILDEATSALDTESESHVQAALNNLMKGRTTLMIAHRLSTVRRADRIVVLEAGQVVEEGGHEALLARGGTYARLAAHGERNADVDALAG